MSENGPPGSLAAAAIEFSIQDASFSGTICDHACFRNRKRSVWGMPSSS
jgi:hypothetical protein